MDDQKFEENMRSLRDSIMIGNMVEFKRIMTREYIEKDGTIDGLGWISWAVRYQQMEILKYLVGLKLDVNQKDGWTALHVASSLGYRECVEYLLKVGGDKGIKSNDGLYPASVAINKHIEKLIGFPGGSEDPFDSMICGDYEKLQLRQERKEIRLREEMLERKRKEREVKRKAKAEKKKEAGGAAGDVADQPDFDDDGFMTL